ncbi:hypothetical protein RJ640_005041 [Escallonia rubra]|uniref:Uncharacterized protein n=1 Tax=Escallonia rubra TaxID=112253 RepID=A0AA88QWL9_9ASTE|nr:hypothetical protein RJ640_005041 [Escallonia rubra]
MDSGSCSGVVEASETQGNKDAKRPRLPDPQREDMALMDSGSCSGVVEASETQGNKDVKRPSIMHMLLPCPCTGLVEASETQGNKDVKRPRLPDPEREEYFVLLGAIERGKEINTSHHLEILESVVKSDNPSQYLLFSRSRICDAFTALLTKEEAEALEGLGRPVWLFHGGEVVLHEM